VPRLFCIPCPFSWMSIMLHTGLDYEKQESMDDSGRLQRPWTVLLFGMLVPVATVIYLAVRTGGSPFLEDKIAVGILVFGILAFLLSVTYVVIGTKVSLALARRVVGIVGGVIALGGVGAIIYAVKKYTS
jgi:hypothetical protein